MRPFAAQAASDPLEEEIRALLATDPTLADPATAMLARLWQRMADHVLRLEKIGRAHV